MNRRVLLLAGALLAAGGCKMFDSSSKSEANSVVRRYSRPAPEVWSALTAALQSLELRIDEDRHDALGGDLTASRATKDTVRISVKSMDELSSQVTIAVGDGDRNMAEIIHSRIAQNLGAGTAKTSFYGGNRWDQTVNSSLARCVLAAERACKETGFTITSRDLRENMADLMANRSSSSSVLMHFEAVPPAGQPPQANGQPAPGQPAPGQQAPGANSTGVPSDRMGQVRVSFIVGTMRSDENEEVIQRLKSAFEGFLR
jgi:hypothetical protein